MDADTPTDLHHLTITQAAEMISRRQLSPVELTRAFIARGEALDPQLHVYIRKLPELALAQAAKAEQEIMAGRQRGRLHGIPFGAKDVFATAGIPTTGHSRAYAEVIPTTDATAITHLYDAGAVLLGSCRRMNAPMAARLLISPGRPHAIRGTLPGSPADRPADRGQESPPG